MKNNTTSGVSIFHWYQNAFTEHFDKLKIDFLD